MQYEYTYQKKYIDYNLLCKKLTDAQPLHLLNNIEKRGFNNYHVDHIVPLIFGYHHNIEEYIMADMINIRCIPKKQNLDKNRYVTKESLIVLSKLISKYSLSKSIYHNAYDLYLLKNDKDLKATIKEIQILRKKHKFSQQKFADKMETTLEHVRLIEIGLAVPSLAYIKNASKILESINSNFLTNS